MQSSRPSATRHPQIFRSSPSSAQSGFQSSATGKHEISQKLKRERAHHGVPGTNPEGSNGNHPPSDVHCGPRWRRWEKLWGIAGAPGPEEKEQSHGLGSLADLGLVVQELPAKAVALLGLAADVLEDLPAELPPPRDSVADAAGRACPAAREEPIHTKGR